MLRADLCDYSDAYIAVKGVITVTNPNDKKRNKSNAFKNNAPLTAFQRLMYSLTMQKTYML